MITTDRQLTAFLPSLDASPWIAIDTEADSLYAYPERLCLLQISIQGSDEIIDPLGEMELSPLWKAFENRELILHGSDFDMRLLRKTVKFVPSVIFDTMIAARLTGERRFGLAALVEKFIGVKLRKGPQKANWSARPLSPKLIEYAIDDSKYLKIIADILKEKLERLGRLDWHQESCRRLIWECSRLPVIDSDRVWRLKGSTRLDRRGLVVLRALWHWREDQALRANRPPYFIVSHENLLAMAQASQRIDPERLRGPRRLSSSRFRSLRKAASRALDTPGDEWPEITKGRSQEEGLKKGDASELKARRDRIAGELGIDPTLIANRATLEHLAGDWDSTAVELMVWQQALLEDS